MNSVCLFVCGFCGVWRDGDIYGVMVTGVHEQQDLRRRDRMPRRCRCARDPDAVERAAIREAGDPVCGYDGERLDLVSAHNRVYYTWMPHRYI